MTESLSGENTMLLHKLWQPAKPENRGAGVSPGLDKCIHNDTLLLQLSA